MGAAGRAAADHGEHSLVSSERRARRAVRVVPGAPLMREVALVSFAQSIAEPGAEARDEIELLLPVINQAIESAGGSRREIGFTVSGSCDFLGGRPFSFVSALDAAGAWPPISESHVEMDGAFALYEAWMRLQHGDIDVALVYAVGRATLGDLDEVQVLQLDPYVLAPLWPDAVSLAALQARALIDAGRATERDFAAVAAARRGLSLATVLHAPYVAAPLRRLDLPAYCDGAAAAVLMAGERAGAACQRPAWLSGIDHRIEPQALGLRDLSRSASTARAAERAGVAAAP